MGAGFIHKTALVLFDNYILQQIFTYLSFLVSWIIVLIYVGRNLQDGLILLYFFLISLIKWPIMQEYYDPLIILMAFTFFSSKLFVNYIKQFIMLFKNKQNGRLPCINSSSKAYTSTTGPQNEWYDWWRNYQTYRFYKSWKNIWPRMGQF